MEAGADPRVGTTLDARYRIVLCIGSGAMGVVYRAERIGLGRSVAVKFLHPSVAGQEQFRKRFEREAKAMSRLTHPHCVSVIDHGFSIVPYVVMDFVHGHDLRTLLDQSSERMKPDDVVLIITQILSGLAHAHEQKIVHRDIKPSNIMITDVTGKGPFVSILDFGLAKLLDAGATDMTGSAILGTPNYMSPEQAKGKPGDERSDLYSTAVLAYEMFSGRKPFESDNALKTLHRQREEEPPPITIPGWSSERSKQLQTVIHRAMAKNPDSRYQTATEFSLALGEVSQDKRAAQISSAATLLASTTEQRAGHRWRGRAVVAMLAVLALAGVALALYYGLGKRGAQSSGETRDDVASTKRLVTPRSSAMTSSVEQAGGGAPAPSSVDARAADTAAASDAGTVDDVESVDAALAGLDITPDGPMTETERVEATLNDIERTIEAIRRRQGLAPRERTPTADDLKDDDDDSDEATGSEGDDTTSDATAGDAERTRASPRGARSTTRSRRAATARRRSARRAKPRDSLRQVKRLLVRRQTRSAIRMLRRLQRRHKKSAYVPYLLGHLYFERGWWNDGAKAYRVAIRRNRRYRRKSPLIRNLIVALRGRRSAAMASSVLRRDVGRAALPYLRRAAKKDRNPRARRRAKQLVRRLRR